ncbi:hypothetical protein GCM10011583_66110 [Streptomyces camponoticapitis]|uniref:Uncharacterized protein n=1 Tax=Streptomyces camponoticapitis TaxID=1616125 RepID=A0ABQ2EVW4_9ACTN|nr:hypothetical protein [Streptomyces camponoticapitis]GGK24809.1 hypothetical protein GCM10011583_66110 [Streptomyces camponoticapitis]
MLAALAALGVALITAVGGIVTVVVGRRQPRGQGRRDDFTKVTERLDKDIERLEGRVTRQEVKISGQSAAITYLSAVVRSLSAFVRESRLQPPPVAAPPEEAKPYLHDIGV